jgi:hypothetical protein
MAGANPDAKNCFDGLNRFRKRYPSNINPDPMCWKVPADEHATKDDCAADGDLGMALALLLAHWEQIGHVLTRPLQLNLDGVKASAGIYAPTHRELIRRPSSMTTDVFATPVIAARTTSHLNPSTGKAAPRVGLATTTPSTSAC